jgi:hypothetical protein
MHDVIVIGAGVAGLQCAGRLVSAGADVLVVDRADKPGGRCATRTFDGQPADYGPLFIHGFDKGFLSAVESVPGARRLKGWPRRVHGGGRPCQPDAFAPFETRMAFSEGLNAFPRSLAARLPIRLRTRVASIAKEGEGMAVVGSEGERFHARDLVLAMALEQSLPFVRSLEPGSGRDGVLALLDMFATLPCLTVIAGYPRSIQAPDWDICYPEDDDALLLMSNESTKGAEGSSLVMVYQAAARWSRQRLEKPKEEWGRELLEAAVRGLGPWASTPQWTHYHRWRYSRMERANELTGPLEIRIGGSRIGLAGDLFSPGGGIQASWLSGDNLAARLTS